MLRKGLLSAVFVVVALTAVSAPLADPPGNGNSVNAKACQKDGWKSLYTRSGQPFSNAGDCTSYAAHGGQLLVKAALPCLNNGWKSLGPTSVQPFTSEQACVDFANAGGTPVAAGSDLGLTKTVSNSSPNVGDTVTFTVTLSNSGPAAATGVTVTDALPSGFTFVSAAPSQGTYTAGTGVWNVGTVTTGTPQTLLLQATVASPSPLPNTAAITHADQSDPNPANNTATVGVHVQQADLAVTKLVNDSSPNVGDTVTFTLVVADNGPDTATNVQLFDLLPTGLTLVSASPSQGTYNAVTGVWTIGTVTTAFPRTMAIQAMVDAANPGKNIAAILHSDQFDPDGSNNSASLQLQLEADLDVAKTVSDATPNVGDTVTFQVTLTDDGPNPATGASVGDLLPDGLTFVSAIPSQGTYNSTTGEWDVGMLLPAVPQTLQIQATVASALPLTNTAVITGADQSDPNLGNNTASAGVQAQIADLAIGKTVAPSSANVGEMVTFTLTLSDNGPDAATNVTVGDLLPSGFGFVSANPSQGSYDNLTGVWDVGTVMTTTPLTLSILATVVSASTSTNTATITHADQFDPDLSNNTASAGLT
jgi:uncharacterized repeat protein (TIGR01451 family)